MSTQHGGGNRKPSTKAVSGAKPKQGGDEVEDASEISSAASDSDVDSTVDSTVSTVEDSASEDSSSGDSSSGDASSGDASSGDASSGDDGSGSSRKPAPARKASPRKSTTARKTTSAPAAGGKRATSTATAPRPAGSRPATGSRPAAKKIAPVKVKQGTSWGPIALFATVAVLALGIIGFAFWQVYENGLSWQDRADRIEGIKDYRESDKALVAQRDHVWGPQKYDLSPPVAGNHNANWQRCQGDVYPAAIANEHALHSLEHGAVWITYNPSLPADQVEKLASKVRGNDYMLMSPYPGLDKPISLQAWGFQLKVDNANDGRIDEFIKALRQNASLEAGTPCSSGDFISETGTTPRDLGKDAPQTGTGG